MAKQHEKTELSSQTRRLLFYKYGSCVFDEDFDLALEYQEAIEFAMGSAKPTGRTWSKRTPVAPLREIHRKLIQIELIAPERTIAIGDLRQQIVEGCNKPKDERRLWIQRVHQEFNITRGRPPTLDELRFWCWYSVPERIGFQPLLEFNADSRILAAWKRMNGDGDEDDKRDNLKSVPERKRFERDVTQMNLRVVDGRLRTNLWQCFCRLQRAAEAVPTKDAYRRAALKRPGNLLPDLASQNLNVLIDFLANPTVSDDIQPWWNVQALLDILKEAMAMRGDSQPFQSKVCDLVNGVARLNTAHTIIELKPLVSIPAIFQSRTLVEVARRTCERQNHFSHTSEIIQESSDEEIEAIFRELRFSAGEAVMVRVLRQALEGRGRSSDSDLFNLASQIPELRVLIQILNTPFRSMLPMLYWEEFVQESSD